MQLSWSDRWVTIAHSTHSLSSSQSTRGQVAESQASVRSRVFAQPGKLIRTSAIAVSPRIYSVNNVHWLNITLNGFDVRELLLWSLPQGPDIAPDLVSATGTRRDSVSNDRSIRRWITYTLAVPVSFTSIMCNREMHNYGLGYCSSFSTQIMKWLYNSWHKGGIKAHFKRRLL